jgi:hypothetical protein
VELTYTIEVRKIWWAYTTLIVSSGALDLKILSQFNTSNLSKVIKPIGFGLLVAALLACCTRGN